MKLRSKSKLRTTVGRLSAMGAMSANGALKGLKARRRKSFVPPEAAASTLDLDGRKLGSSGCLKFADQLAPRGRLASVQVLNMRNCQITRGEHQLQVKRESTESGGDSDAGEEMPSEANAHSEGTAEARTTAQSLTVQDDMTGLAALCSVLKRPESRVLQLTLAHNALFAEGAHILFSSLEHNRRVTALDVSHCMLTAAPTAGRWRAYSGGAVEGVIALGRLLAANHTLTDVNISHNDLSDGSGETFVGEAMRVNSSCTTLRIAGNNLGEAGICALTQALEQNKTLAYLDVGSNHLGKGGCTKLCSSLAELGSRSGLRVLDLSNNSVGAEGTQAIVALIESSETLEALHLGQNGLGAVGAKRLGAAMLDIDPATQAMRSLHLVHNGLGVPGTRALVEALRAGAHITDLDLSDNQLGHAVVLPIEEMPPGWRTRFDEASNRRQYLDPEGGRWSPKPPRGPLALRLLCDVLREHSSPPLLPLLRLKLSQNHINTPMLGDLLNAMAGPCGSCAIQELSLSPAPPKTAEVLLDFVRRQTEKLRTHTGEVTADGVPERYLMCIQTSGIHGSKDAVAVAWQRRIDAALADFKDARAQLLAQIEKERGAVDALMMATGSGNRRLSALRAAATRAAGASAAAAATVPAAPSLPLPPPSLVGRTGHTRQQPWGHAGAGAPRTWGWFGDGEQEHNGAAPRSGGAGASKARSDRDRERADGGDEAGCRGVVINFTSPLAHNPFRQHDASSVAHDASVAKARLQKGRNARLRRRLQRQEHAGLVQKDQERELQRAIQEQATRQREAGSFTCRMVNAIASGHAEHFANEEARRKAAAKAAKAAHLAALDASRPGIETWDMWKERAPPPRRRVPKPQWVEAVDPSIDGATGGRRYWYDTRSGDTRWTKPSTAQVRNPELPLIAQANLRARVEMERALRAAEEAKQRSVIKAEWLELLQLYPNPSHEHWALSEAHSWAMAGDAEERYGLVRPSVFTTDDIETARELGASKMQELGMHVVVYFNGNYWKKGQGGELRQKTKGWIKAKKVKQEKGQGEEPDGVSLPRA